MNPLWFLVGFAIGIPLGYIAYFGRFLLIEYIRDQRDRGSYDEPEEREQDEN